MNNYMTFKEKRPFIIMLTGLVALIFCFAPFIDDYRNDIMESIFGFHVSALIDIIDEPDNLGMIFFAICTILLPVVQYIRLAPEYEEYRKTVTVGLSVLLFVLFYAGASYEYEENMSYYLFDKFYNHSVMLFMPLSLLALFFTAIYDKFSFKKLARSITPFMIVMALLTFLFVPFEYHFNGVQLLRVYFSNQDFFLYAFVFPPVILLVLLAQLLPKANVRYYATFALFLPFLTYDDKFYAGLFMYILIVALASYSAYYVMKTTEKLPADNQKSDSGNQIQTAE